jgi:class 3 adenylate cyclase/predicted ATPase
MAPVMRGIPASWVETGGEIAVMDCPSCGGANAHDGRFCNACGAALVRNCAACGNANAPANRYCGHCGAALDGAEPAERRAVAAPRPGDAERRQLTLMFCDLVGSTALSALLDPEDMREIIGAYHRCCAEVIERHGGMIGKYMGDGVLALFGYPRAQEDDAERAVRAGLAVVEALGRLALRGGAVQVRVGVATGLVVVGDLLGEGAEREQGVVGETPNLAARLQALAEPGTVVIAQSTRQLVGELFQCTSLGSHRLKGFAAPIDAWRVIRESGGHSRFEALRTRSFRPLVGRNIEIALLLDRWEKAQRGEGQMVLLVGQPGVGKSRLAHAVARQLAEPDRLQLHYYCSPFHPNSALYPVLEQLKRAADFAHDDAPDQRLNKLEHLIDSFGQSRDVIPLLAHLMSIPGGERYPPPVIERSQQKEATLAALCGLLVRAAERQPLLIVAEDLHWIDPTSLELLDMLARQIPRLPILLIATFRPEMAVTWSGDHVTSATIRRLSRRQSLELLQRLTDDKPIPSAISTQILERTDGIPLFIEEMTKSVLESGVLQDAGDHYELSHAAPLTAIPATLRDSLMARLDRLAEVKSVAQVGAAIGRSFSYELLAAILPLSPDAVRDALGRLAASGLIFTRGTPPRADYTFKHALVQEIAYESLLRTRRQDLHRRIAQALGELFPDIGAAQPELLAHHYGLGGDAERAIDHWLMAGKRAAARSAEVEAIRDFERALGALQTLPETPERSKRELAIRIALLTPIIALKGYASPDTAQAAAAARALADRVGEAEQLFPIMYGEWTSNMVSGKVPAARDLAEQYLRLAKRQADATPLIIGHRIFGNCLFYMGEPLPAVDELQHVIRLYDPTLHASSAFLYGHDSRVSSLCFLALALLILGRPRQAFDAARDALAYAEEIKHANTQGVALCLAGSLLSELVHDMSASRHFAATLVTLSQQHGMALWLAAGHVLNAWATAQRGRAVQSVAAMAKAIDGFRAIGALLTVPHFLGLQAEMHAAAGQPGAGLDAVAEALAMMRATGQTIWEADLYRIEGELRLAQGRSGAEEAAAALFEQAIATARRQGARFWELRATTALARLRVTQGKPGEAQAALSAIVACFTDGHEIPDLAQAKLLLEKWATPSVASG